MRLTCPNCGARYDVDDAMIPPEGRDVQCSDCVTTWFQPGLRRDAALTGVHVARPRPPVSQRAGGGETAPRDDMSDPPQPPRRELDPAVRDILMQEAAREARLRQGDAAPVTTQNDRPQAEPGSRAPAAVPDAVDVEVDAGNADDAPGTVSRRDLLPDIAEIGSTLRAGGDRGLREDTTSDIDTLDAEPRRRAAVRTGFFGVLILAGLGAALYAYADPVSTSVPAAADLLDVYVETVNAARFWVHDTLTGLAEG